MTIRLGDNVTHKRGGRYVDAHGNPVVGVVVWIRRSADGQLRARVRWAKPTRRLGSARENYSTLLVGSLRKLDIT